MFTLFLTSGLFLGWSLGANDAANIFGSAVGSRMVSFRKAAIIASIFVILGAVIQGAGTTETLGKLGRVNAIAGAFVVAFSAAFVVYYMTKLKIPVSTSQAIVGGIIGWNIYSGFNTDYTVLSKIALTWVFSPVLGAVFSILLFILLKAFIKRSKIHLVKLDSHLRWGLLIVGAFGAYSLGANNIANVMGVFVSSSPLPDMQFYFFSLSGTQILFFIGGVAIAIGIITYSRHIMETVGNNLMELTSESAIIVVLSQALVLFVFSSSELSNILTSMGLPPIPLVPVSSSQAIVGAVIGIGLYKGGREINYKILGGIAFGWISTPVVTCLFAILLLFFMENVFQQTVSVDQISQIPKSIELGAKITFDNKTQLIYIGLIALVIGFVFFIVRYIIYNYKEEIRIKEKELKELNVRIDLLETNLRFAEEDNMKMHRGMRKAEKAHKNLMSKIRKVNKNLEEEESEKKTPYSGEILKILKSLLKKDGKK